MSDSLAGLAMRYKDYTKDVMRSIRICIVNFINFYKKDPNEGLLPEFYSHCTSILLKSSDELLKHLDSCENVRTLDCALKGVLFFLNEPIPESQASRIQQSNDV